MASEPFATCEDLAASWRPLDETERVKVGKLIDYASDLIRTYSGWRTDSATTLERICCSVVRLTMESDANGAPAGASNMTQTAGAFSKSFAFSNASGDPRLWPSEEAQLRRNRNRYGSLDMMSGTLVDHDQG
ncbi:hypothetical protein [Bifidobacterium gallicum]|uniref:Phage protein Gp19/Gp15/Gp42 n=1 Tax=Bifidobacterium gallicum DSM 20093 = LMG 11596 TaxID=561180 RepID=D1NSL7_9BIFI|nr:hypothetical protein [Bifidobacterium gallicum]EFA23669.1 hypothetical protein BIFGAL_02775 [Bifidobacterium gallicum DSM 20093 = LMG 11596]KFI58727.1 Phage protein Gp19/Gp15/Gp42 [Bifidobacterium gallicum DSM 20093 = LMG 11596]